MTLYAKYACGMATIEPRPLSSESCVVMIVGSKVWFSVWPVTRYRDGARTTDQRFFRERVWMIQRTRTIARTTNNTEPIPMRWVCILLPCTTPRWADCEDIVMLADLSLLIAIRASGNPARAADLLLIIRLEALRPDLQQWSGGLADSLPVPLQRPVQPVRL
jgi:hypothetical protein